jgi:hypothetical protein
MLALMGHALCCIALADLLYEQLSKLMFRKLGGNMKMIVKREDLEEIANVFRRRGDAAMKISDVVTELSKARQITEPTARYVVRSAIDKGALRTDRDFKLHLNTVG